MGSLFVVTVPLRSFEFKLRLKENDLLASLTLQIDPPEEGDDISLLHAFKMPGGDESAKGVMARDISLPGTKDVVQAYRINKEGKLLLLVTRDTMKLTHADTIPFLNLGSDTYSPETQTPSSGRRVSFSSAQTTDDVELTDVINNCFLEKHLEDALTKFELLYASWEPSIDENFSQVCFSVKADRADEIINHMHTVGIGKKYCSALCVCASSVYSEEPRERKVEEEDEEGKGKWEDFVQSIKARLTVAQVVQNVKANAIITFDFIVMVFVAGIIAGLGLFEDSPVNLIASMLVSPLMGPIMAFTFGAMIRDYSLIKTGVLSEIAGLGMCWSVGLIFGIFAEAKPLPGPWAEVTKWPSNEMYGRAQYRALWVGAGIATASGAGVALSILAGNAGSLVGVAISASLLPPCVNCGIFYGMALVILCSEIFEGRYPMDVPCEQFLEHGDPSDPKLDIWRGHRPLYCNNVLQEYAIMGTISLCLTLLNIVLIFFIGIICLKIKEVAPYTTKEAYERFWKHDLKTARDYNIAHTQEDALMRDIDDPNVLHAVEDDFVFKRIRNRAMFSDEDNVIQTVKARKSRPAVPEGPKTNWLSWFGSNATVTPGDAENPKPPAKIVKN